MKRRLALLLACSAVIALIACGLNPQPLPPDERENNASSTTMGPMHVSSSGTSTASNPATSSGAPSGSLGVSGSSMVMGPSATTSSATTETSSGATASSSSGGATADSGDGGHAGDGGVDAQGDSERPDGEPMDGASEHDADARSCLEGGDDCLD